MTDTATMPARTLGRTGPTTSALGVGTWALGGPFSFDGRDAGWGPVDDAVSVRALHTAIEHGAGAAGGDLRVAGNTVEVTGGVMQAASSGVLAGSMINADLTAEDTARAVDAAGSSSRM